MLTMVIKMADWTRGEVRRKRGRFGRGASHPRSRRTAKRSAVGSDGRSVYELQTMALFPREKRDTTVK